MIEQRKNYPSDLSEQYMVRFPDGLRSQIRQIALKNGRSMNAEIISRLQATFVEPHRVRWEYCMITLKTEDIPLHDLANGLGDQGWEMVAIYSGTAVFKRQRGDYL